MVIFCDRHQNRCDCMGGHRSTNREESTRKLFLLPELTEAPVDALRGRCFITGKFSLAGYFFQRSLAVYTSGVSADDVIADDFIDTKLLSKIS